MEAEIGAHLWPVNVQCKHSMLNVSLKPLLSISMVSVRMVGLGSPNSFLFSLFINKK